MPPTFTSFQKAVVMFNISLDLNPLLLATRTLSSPYSTLLYIINGIASY